MQRQIRLDNLPKNRTLRLIRLDSIHVVSIMRLANALGT